MRLQTNHQKFSRLHQNLVEQGSLRAKIEHIRRPPTTRTLIFEKGVLHTEDRNPDSSVRAHAVATGRSRKSIHCVLLGEVLHPFNVKRVQL